MTTIHMNGTELIFVNPDTKVLVQTSKEHGYIVETFHKKRDGLGWEQSSRMSMSVGNFDFTYEHLSTPFMSEVLVNPEHVSFEAFTALVNSLK